MVVEVIMAVGKSHLRFKMRGDRKALALGLHPLLL